MRLLLPPELSAPALIALDDAIFHRIESGTQQAEMLRLWEFAEPTVVLGRFSKIDDEVDRHACRKDGVAIVRRSTGGASILAGPGCLMYSLVFNLRERPELAIAEQTHRFVLQRHADALRELGINARCQGTSDLAVVEPDGALRKISGNSMRVGRNAVLYHGTLLYDFPLERIAEYLRFPPRTPDYRMGRSHEDFVRNIGIGAEQLRERLCDVWEVNQRCSGWPSGSVAQLVDQRYGTKEWTEAGKIHVTSSEEKG